MSDERRTPGGPGRTGGDPDRAVTSSRARNRTVMLTPEMTGQVRALLYNEEAQPEQAGEPAISSEGRPDPLNDVLSSGGWARPERSEPVPSALNTGPSINDFAPLPQSDVPGAGFGGGFTSNFENFGMPQTTAPQPRTSAFGTPSVQGGSLFQNAPSPGQPPAGLGRSFSGIQNAIGEQPSLGAPRKERSTKRFHADDVSHAQEPMQQMITPVPVPAPNLQPQRRINSGKVIGFLVSFDEDDNGETFDIRSGRLLITCRPTDQGDYILIDHPTVSPLHAIIRATKEGKVEVLDQLSEYGTGIIRVGEQEETEVAGARMSLQHGDVLRFGERRFVVCLVPATQRPAPKSADAPLKEGKESVAD